MLANLDNEVHFKRVFTDVTVFKAFVKDVLGIEMDIDKVETEKVLPSRVSAIKFRMDLFAEDVAKRTVVEIQKVDYDYSFDRFSHYFLGNLIDMQRSSKIYAFDKEVYIIVVVTAAYRVSDKTGQPLKDDVLITDINPRTINGEIRDMYNHKMVVLNTTHVDEKTPQEIRDWLDLIIESMKNPKDPHINKGKTAIVRAAQLAEKDDIDPEEIHEAKIQEMRKVNVALIEDEGIKKGMKLGIQEGLKEGKKEGIKEGIKEGVDLAKKEGIKKAIKQGKLSFEDIAELFDVSVEYVKLIESE